MPDFPYPLNSFQCMDALAFLKSLPSESIHLFLFSPPYNMGHSSGGGMQGNTSKTGKWRTKKLREGYDNHNDNMSPPDYLDWQGDILRECARALSMDGAIYYNHKPRIFLGRLLAALDYVPESVRPLVRQEIIWARAGGINFNETFYVPTTERIVLVAKPDFNLVPGGSSYGDVWTIPQEIGTWHPAPFPLSLALRVVETTAPRLMCDPFAGSGTTAVAAKMLGVPYLCNDLSLEYVRRAEERVAQTPVSFFQAGEVVAGVSNHA